MATIEETRRPGTVPVVGLVVLSTGLVLMAVSSWRVAGQLPNPVTFAGTGQDGAAQQAPRMVVLTAMPLLALAIGAVLLAAQRLRRTAASALRIPLWRDALTQRKATDLGLGVLVPVLLALHLLVLRAAEGRGGSALGNVAAAVALVIVIVGNLWPKHAPAVPNRFRTRLDSAAQQRLDQGLEAHRRLLRPTGTAMVLLGLVALACSWLAPLVSLGLCLVAVLVLGGALLFATFTRRP